MTEFLRSFVLRLTYLLTGWAIPLLVALAGTGLYAWSGKFTGEQRTALQITAWVMWINAPIYNMRGYAVTALLANETYNAAPFYERFKKVEPIIYEYSEPQTTRILYLGLPVEPAKLRTIAQNPRPFSEPEMVTKRRVLSGGEFRALQAEMVRRQMLAPKGTNKRQGYDWTPVGECIMADIAAGKIKPGLRRSTAPLPHLT